MKAKYTYVTLASTASYIDGVIVLYRSLKKYGRTNYSLLCLCSKSISIYDIQRLENAGIQYKIISTPALVGYTELVNTKVLHWNYTFDKLLIWGLTEYEKIVFLDSDMLVVAPIDDLFNRPNNSAVMSDYSVRGSNYLNSGLMVVEPNLAVMESMLSAIHEVINLKADNQFGIGDQDVINYRFADWNRKYELHLPEGYNIYQISLKLYSDINFSDTSVYDEKKIRVVHFIGKLKPWMMSPWEKIRSLLGAIRRKDWLLLKFYLIYFKLLNVRN